MIKVIIVEPLYQINLGYIARVLRNFGFNSVHLVKPRCNYKGKQAIKYSKHAHQVLTKAKIYKTFEDSIKGSDFVVGTTGIWHKSGKAFFNAYTLDKLSSIIKKNKLSAKNVALVIGRDDTGLTRDEIQMCDATLFIPADKDYSILNISHALAVILYEFTKDKAKIDYASLENLYANNKEKERIIQLFGTTIKNRTDIRDKKAVISTFQHIIRRANPTKRELSALAIALTPNKKNKQQEKN